MSTLENQNPETGTAKERLRSKAGDVAQDVRELGGIAKEAASEQARDVKHRAQGYYREGKDRVSQWEGSLERKIIDHPLKSIAIAAGAGLVLGMFFRR